MKKNSSQPPRRRSPYGISYLLIFHESQLHVIGQFSARGIKSWTNSGLKKKKSKSMAKVTYLLPFQRPFCNPCESFIGPGFESDSSEQQTHQNTRRSNSQ